VYWPSTPTSSGGCTKLSASGRQSGPNSTTRIPTGLSIAPLCISSRAVALTPPLRPSSSSEYACPGTSRNESLRTSARHGRIALSVRWTSIQS